MYICCQLDNIDLMSMLKKVNNLIIIYNLKDSQLNDLILQ